MFLNFFTKYTPFLNRSQIKKKANSKLWFFQKESFSCQYFPKLYENSGGNVKNELDLTNYATKTDLKATAGVDMYTLAAKSDLASLEAEVDKKI